MGGLNSYFIRCCISSNNCPENHCKLKITHSNRSFTFNKIEEDDRQQEFPKLHEVENITLGFVNVNEASEDALMTLPGVNRKIAHDIILHRSCIGNFKKIEDVALVNGIGAAKFKLIKSEISIDSNRNNSNIIPPDIFINEFDIFQFTKISGFSQTLAERIVSYREKKGPFKSLKDFQKVRGVNSKILNSLRPYIHFKMRNGIKVDSQKKISKESISDAGSNPEEFLQFTTPSNSEFNFYLNVWQIKNPMNLIPESFIESALSSSNTKPTIIILIYSESNIASKDHIYRLFNEKSGQDNCFNIVQCNVGDSCIHNNDKSSFIIFANFEHFSKKIILNSLIEDLLTYMILTIKVGNNHSLHVVVSFNCPPNEKLVHDEAGLSLFNDLALKLKSGNENSFVFLCDSAVKEIADSAFLNNEFHFIDQSVDDDNKENKEFVITTFKKIANTTLSSSSSSDLQIKIQQITAQHNDYIIQNDFDVTVLLC